MELITWICVSIAVFVNISHSSTTLPISTTGIKDILTSAELSTLEIISSTTTAAEMATSETKTTINSTQNEHVSASGEVNVSKSSTTSPTSTAGIIDSVTSTELSSLEIILSSSTTDETATSETKTTISSTQNQRVSASGEALPTSRRNTTDTVASVELSSIEIASTTTPAQLEILTTATAISTQSRSGTAFENVSAFYSRITLPTNTTYSSGNESTSGVYLSTSWTITKEASQQPTTSIVIKTQTPLITVPREGEGVKNNNDRIIIAVVVSVIGSTALIVAIFILYTRRCKKLGTREATKPETASVPPFNTYQSFRESNISFGATTDIIQYSTMPSASVHASNGKKKDDENIIKYSKPEKIQNNTKDYPENRNYRDDVLADENEMKEINMESADNLPDYEHLPATEKNVSYGKYSQVTIELQKIPVSTENENENVLCQSEKDHLGDHEDSDNTQFIRPGEENRGVCDYLATNADVGLVKEYQTNLAEEEIYNHTDH